MALSPSLTAALPGMETPTSCNSSGSPRIQQHPSTLVFDGDHSCLPLTSRTPALSTGHRIPLRSFPSASTADPKPLDSVLNTLAGIMGLVASVAKPITSIICLISPVVSKMGATPLVGQPIHKVVGAVRILEADLNVVNSTTALQAAHQLSAADGDPIESQDATPLEQPSDKSSHSFPSLWGDLDVPQDLSKPERSYPGGLLTRAEVIGEISGALDLCRRSLNLTLARMALLPKRLKPALHRRRLNLALFCRRLSLTLRRLIPRLLHFPHHLPHPITMDIPITHIGWGYPGFLPPRPVLRRYLSSPSHSASPPISSHPASRLSIHPPASLTGPAHSSKSAATGAAPIAAPIAAGPSRLASLPVQPSTLATPSHKAIGNAKTASTSSCFFV
ncbi:hypothetical protein JB92DRAFT_3102243 [Gautieria morchelliformis]|nr:hypothetical protein JB92DRAFT_3102243 [Gautieria morchelliformis]